MKTFASLPSRRRGRGAFKQHRSRGYTETINKKTTNILTSVSRSVVEQTLKRGNDIPKDHEQTKAAVELQFQSFEEPA